MSTDKHFKTRYHERKAAGVCTNHPHRPLFTTALCEECAKKAVARRPTKGVVRVRRHFSESRARWEVPGIDWSLSNWHLAKVMDCHPAGVRYHRKRLGK